LDRNYDAIASIEVIRLELLALDLSEAADSSIAAGVAKCFTWNTILVISYVSICTYIDCISNHGNGLRAPGDTPWRNKRLPGFGLPAAGTRVCWGCAAHASPFQNRVKRLESLREAFAQSPLAQETRKDGASAPTCYRCRSSIS